MTLLSLSLIRVDMPAKRIEVTSKRRDKLVATDEHIKTVISDYKLRKQIQQLQDSVDIGSGDDDSIEIYPEGGGSGGTGDVLAVNIYYDNEDEEDDLESLQDVVTDIKNGKANTALSNLIATAINQSLKPYIDNLLDLGDNSKRWRDLYLSGSVSNGTSEISVADLISGSSGGGNFLSEFVETLGGQTEFTLLYTPTGTSPGNVLVFVNGLRLFNNKYSLSGRLLTLSDPCNTGDEVVLSYFYGTS